MAPNPWVIMDSMVRPVDCKRRSSMISRNTNPENTVTICRYASPEAKISGMSVWERIKETEPNRPNNRNSTAPATASRMPFPAARLARS